MIHLCLWPSWGNLILVVVWIKSLATAAWSFCSGSRSHRLNFATTHFMPRSCIKTSDTVVLGIPWSASSSCTVSHRSLLIAACTHSAFSGVLLLGGLPECASFSADSQAPLKHLCHTFICTALIALSLKAFWIIWIVSTEECLSLMQNWMQIHCSACPVILNVMAAEYTSSLNGVYHPHWLLQWSHHCSHMCIPVHFPWLLGYIDVTQVILVILGMAGQTSYIPHLVQAL